MLTAAAFFVDLPGCTAPSAASALRPKSNPLNGFPAPDRRTVANDADGRDGELAADRPR